MLTLIIKILRIIRNRTDHFLFAGEHKWFFIQWWMLNGFFYSIVKKLKLREGEHQIGRLRNQKAIFRSIKENPIPGDVIEFGSYQGFGLYWLALFRNRFKIKNMKIIGVDSFQGLPESSTMWTKGQFNDTSIELCETKLCKMFGTKTLRAEEIYLIKGLFDDSAVKSHLGSISQNFLIIHVDCDLGSSCLSALEMVKKLNLNRYSYLLFDDWYLQEEEIPRSFDRFESETKGTYSLTYLSRTRFTKYFTLSVR